MIYNRYRQRGRTASFCIEALDARWLLSVSPLALAPSNADATTARLVVKQSPAETLVGSALTPTPIIAVEDQAGNVVTQNRSKVTLSLVTAPAGAQIHGATSINVHKGLATFKKLSVNEAGSYTFQASDVSLPITAPVAFSETVTPGSTTIAAPKLGHRYIVGKTIKISSTLKSSAGKSVPFTGSATLVDQNNNVIATATPNKAGIVKFSYTGSTAGTDTLTVQYAGDASHASAVSPSKAVEFVAKAVHIPVGKDLTYIGQFAATYSVLTVPPYSNNPQPPVTGTVSFNITLVLHPLATVNGLTTYTIKSVQCSDPFFGAQFAITPNFGSVAILPNPPSNISTQDGEGFSILFPNGSTLVTANAAGDMHESSDARTISNSLSDTQAWIAGSNNNGQFLEDSIIPVHDYRGSNVGDFTTETWALTLSAT